MYTNFFFYLFRLLNNLLIYSSNKKKVFIQTFDKSTESQLASLQDLTTIMTNSKSATFLDGTQQPPVGCALSTLSDKCKLYILLKGIIDIEKEETKLSKKREGLLQQIEAIKKEQAKENYESRVPEAVRQKNQEKVFTITITIFDIFILLYFWLYVCVIHILSSI